MADLKIKRAPSVESNDRAWNQVYDDINDIINAVNNKSGNEARTKGTDGQDGDIRLYKDRDAGKYFIEGKFTDGWAKRQLLFTDSNETGQEEVVNISNTENYVRKDGTIAFTATVGGVDPTADVHLTTRSWVEGRIATKDTLAELSDTNISTTNGHMIKYDSDNSEWISFAANFLTAYAVNDSYTGSTLSPAVFGLKQTGISSSTTIRGVRSQDESTLVITLVEDVSNGAYLKFNVPSPTGIQTVQGYDQVNDNYASAISGNTNLKFNDAWNTGTSTGIFFTVTDSGSDTIISPTIAFPANSDTTYTTSLVDSGDNAIIRLTAGGSGSGNDDLTLVAGTNITLAPSGDNLTITANNTTNYSLVNSDKSSSHSFVMTNTGTEGRIRNIKAGSNITMTTTDDYSDTGYVTVNASLSNATIDVSEVNPLGGYLTYESSNLRFIDNGGITWALGRPGSSVTTVTPSFTLPSHNHGATEITSGTIADAQLPSDCGANTSYAASSHSHSYISTSHQANNITSTHITVLGNTSGSNSGDQTLSTRASLGIDTDDDVAFGSITCENGVVIVDTTDESGATAGFKYIQEDRIDIGWGGSYGANMELYSKTHSSRAGEFKLIYGTGGAAGSVYFTHKSGSHVDMAKLTHDGDWHVDKDVYAYSSSVGSDRKLKENIVDTKYGLKDVLKLRGVDFDWKEKRNKAHDIGVIAQEIQEVVPEVVMEVEDLNGEDTHLTVDYAKLVPVLIEAIKELKKEIDNGFCKCK